MLALLAATLFSSLAASLAILDELDDFSLGTVVELLCADAKVAQISRISTLVAVSQRLQQDPANCNSQVVLATHQLARLLTDNNLNVCGQRKIDSIVDFHRKFVAAKNSPRLPQMLEVFFKYYALQVSATCKKSLLDEARGEFVTRKLDQHQHLFGDRGNLDRIIKLTRRQFGSVSSRNDYDDVTLIWSVIGELANLKEGKRLSKYLRLEEPEKIVSLKLRDSTQLLELQRRCRQQLRPISTLR